MISGLQAQYPLRVASTLRGRRLGLATVEMELRFTLLPSLIFGYPGARAAVVVEGATV